MPFSRLFQSRRLGSDGPLSLPGEREGEQLQEIPTRQGSFAHHSRLYVFTYAADLLSHWRFRRFLGRFGELAECP